MLRKNRQGLFDLSPGLYYSGYATLLLVADRQIRVLWLALA